MDVQRATCRRAFIIYSRLFIIYYSQPNGLLYIFDYILYIIFSSVSFTTNSL